jgi:hypothetical protein
MPNFDDIRSFYPTQIGFPKSPTPPVANREITQPSARGFDLNAPPVPSHPLHARRPRPSSTTAPRLPPLPPNFFLSLPSALPTHPPPAAPPARPTNPPAVSPSRAGAAPSRLAARRRGGGAPFGGAPHEFLDLARGGRPWACRIADAAVAARTELSPLPPPLRFPGEFLTLACANRPCSRMGFTASPCVFITD